MDIGILLTIALALNVAPTFLLVMPQVIQQNVLMDIGSTKVMMIQYAHNVLIQIAALVQLMEIVKPAMTLSIYLMEDVFPASVAV
jgi:hypothetical protein